MRHTVHDTFIGKTFMRQLPLIILKVSGWKSRGAKTQSGKIRHNRGAQYIQLGFCLHHLSCIYPWDNAPDHDEACLVPLAHGTRTPGKSRVETCEPGPVPVGTGPVDDFFINQQCCS